MPRRNRVTPMGDLIADPARGLVYGNRGCLHDDEGRIIRAYGVRRWIACRLEFRGWNRVSLMQPGRFTELFFLDEATAIAAGHRPCRMCRHEDYQAFVATWGSIHPRSPMNAEAIDDRLHEERWDSTERRRRLHESTLDELPEGVFVMRDDQPWLVRDRQLLRWTPGGYSDRVARPRRGEATVITPPSLVEVLRAARVTAVPFLHPSAGA